MEDLKLFISMEIGRMAEALGRGCFDDALKAVKAITLCRKYDYLITDGRIPSGGWTPTPRARRENSWRRDRKLPVERLVRRKWNA